MTLGDTQEVVVGVVAGIGADYLSSITVMKNNDVAVQNAYNNLFILPKAPSQADMKITPLDKQLVLDWGSNLSAVKATEEFDRQGYVFEGYNVYQLPTASSSFAQAVPLATYDKGGNGIRTIADTIFDVGLGISTIVVKQKGTDSGIKRQLLITQDKVRNAPLVNGQSYYYAVTTYGYNPSSQALTHALESSLQIVIAIPQGTAPGERISSKYNDTLKVTNTNPGTIKSDGGAVPIMVDPTKATGKSYKVSFKKIPKTFTYGPDSNGDVDTSTVDMLNWFLISGTDTLYRSINQGPTVPINPGTHNLAPEVGPIFGNQYDYPIVDGFFISVAGPPPQLNETRSRFTQGTSWLSGSGRFVSSTGALRSQATTGYDIDDIYLGATGPGVDPSLYRDIEFRFSAGGVGLKQKAYEYTRGAVTGGETGSGYKFLAYVDVPFQVWDVSNPASPRQLNCGWRDQNRDGKWVPGSSTDQLEIIFVATSTYDGDSPTTFKYGTQVGFSTNNIPRGDYQACAEWLSANGSLSDITESVILVSPNRVLTEADAFTFTAPAKVSYNAATAKADVSAINVFPNPYYGFNRAETSRFQRFVTFNHLPKTVEVRIFNIAGALVKALVKDDASQFMNWDLSNINNLPVASGLYIAHLKLKDAAGADLGTKILKIIIIQEQQYLDNF
jgi:hypothetical protein